MPSLVITTQGAQVRCAGGEVLVESEGRTLQRVPEAQVERALLLGRVHLTSGFLELAFSRRLPVTFLTQDGAFKGRLDPGGLRDVALRLAQYRALEDQEWRLRLSRLLVQSKVAGQRAVLLRSCRNRPVPEVAAGAAELQRLAANLDQPASLPALMGQEGRAARVYFAALPFALRRPLPFRGRSRRPPQDPMNALLSLGYGLLSAELLGALSGVGLDPQIGIFHSSRGRMPALAQDLVELFRAPVADTLALSLANLGILQEHDFGPGEEGGVVLKKEALTVYFRHYRRKMQAPFRDRRGRSTSFRKEVQTQAAHLRRVILREEEYQPFLLPGGGPRPPGQEPRR